jgi:chromosome segregation ATPase
VGTPPTTTAASLPPPLDVLTLLIGIAASLTGGGEEARERADQARQRSAEIADRLTRLRQSDGPTAETVEEAKQAARRSMELATEGYEHAAEGMERSADAYERAADGLELRAGDAGEDREDLLRRARQHVKPPPATARKRPRSPERLRRHP